MTLRRPTRRAALIGGGLGLAVLATIISLNALASSTIRQATDELTDGAVATADAALGSAEPAEASAPVPLETPADLTVSLDGLSTAVAAQLSYLLEFWNDPNDDEFGWFEDYDCMNFTSQTLLARGWEHTDDWWNGQSGDPLDASTTWYSSTAFLDWLGEHPELGTALTDDDREQLSVGDIVQFDWDNSGDRDHTGIVTRIDHNADGSISVYYAGHTDDTLLRSVDWALSVLHPGATAYYWHLS